MTCDSEGERSRETRVSHHTEEVMRLSGLVETVGFTSNSAKSIWWFLSKVRLCVKELASSWAKGADSDVFFANDRVKRNMGGCIQNPLSEALHLGWKFRLVRLYPR